MGLSLIERVYANTEELEGRKSGGNKKDQEQVKNKAMY